MFFFPLSYVIAKNGYVEQNSAKYHSLTEKDTLYIETEKTEFEILYRICFNQQGKKNVVFELKAVDDSSIDFVQSYTINGVKKFDCFAVYDNVADGNRFLFFDYYNPQIQISAESGTKRSIFRQKNKTKRSKKRLHTTLIKPEQKVNEDLCSGFIVS